jgi:non-canonical poly(A) RNA polymerase PAPD5/7
MRFKKRTKFKQRKNNFSKEEEKGFKIVFSRKEKNDVVTKKDKEIVKNNKNLSDVPWIREKTKEYSGILRLHHEIIDFYYFIKPTGEESKNRHETINLLRTLINDKWPHWKIKIFGSFPNDLHLPNSDIDVVIFKQESVNLKNLFSSAKDSILSDTSQLQMIYRELLTKNFVSEIRYVDAKVPIIKATCKQTWVNMDIS